MNLRNQFIEVFIHRHCAGHYPVTGGSGIEIPLRICCLIGYYHNTAFISFCKDTKKFWILIVLCLEFIFIFYNPLPSVFRKPLARCRQGLSKDLARGSQAQASCLSLLYACLWVCNTAITWLQGGGWDSSRASINIRLRVSKNSSIWSCVFRRVMM